MVQLVCVLKKKKICTYTQVEKKMLAMVIVSSERRPLENKTHFLENNYNTFTNRNVTINFGHHSSMWDWDGDWKLNCSIKCLYKG